MKYFPVPASISILALTACSGDPAQSGAGAQSAFRVRSDFAAELNSDQGWAGPLNENVTVNADQPFRLRFEVAHPAESTGSRQFRLQYRRNRGDWTDVEAHDFPHPVREHEVDFAKADAGATPEGWSLVQGNAEGMAVVADGRQKVLRAQADQEPLIGLYPPPWESKEFTFAAGIRLPAANRNGVGLVFGYVDARNYCRVFLDAAAGAIRVSRFVDGTETAVTEQRAGIVSGQWLEVEIQFEDDALEVNYQDDTLEFTADLGTGIPPSPLGFQVPANSTAEFREFGIEAEPKTPRVSIVACGAYENGAATTDPEWSEPAKPRSAPVGIRSSAWPSRPAMSEEPSWRLPAGSDPGRLPMVISTSSWNRRRRTICS